VLGLVDSKSDLRYRDNGRAELDNNAADRVPRAIVLGRKNHLFAGASSGC